MSDLDDILSSGAENAPAAQETIAHEQPTQEAPAAETPAETPPDEGNEVGDVAAAIRNSERRKYKDNLAAVEAKLAQLETQNQQLQQFLQAAAVQQRPAEPPKVPDFWEAPETAIDYRLNQTVAPLQSQLMQMREDFSKMQAIDKHGQEAVDRAYSELARLRASNDPAFGAEYQRIMSSPHPYGALVDWHRKQQAMAEIGSDPAAYKEKLKAELLAELQASAPQPSQPAAQSVMPSNFATARNVGQRSGPNWGGPAPLNDIFKR